MIAGVLIFVVLLGGAFAFRRTRKSSSPSSPSPTQKPTKPPSPPPSSPQLRKPSHIKVTANPVSIEADGSSKSALTVQLLDDKDVPVVASSDVVVELFAAKGKLDRLKITIPQGESEAKTSLTSSLDRGSVLVSARAEGLGEGVAALNFKEEEMRCLYCGAVTTSMYEPCPECGRIPP